MKQEIKDLRGQRIGRLTVVEKVLKNNRTHWKCQCDCGKEKTIKHNNIVRPNGTKSCGCLRLEKAREMYTISMLGKRFGKLSVTRKVVENHGPIRWVCKCDCGKETMVVGYSLRQGDTTSCGCNRSKAIQLAKRKEPFRWLYSKLSNICRQTSKELGLSFEEFVEFTKNPFCHYCHLPVIWNEHNNAEIGYSGYNLDRKDNTKGYSKENCVVCCRICNKVKGDFFSYEDMKIKLGPVIQEIKTNLGKQIHNRFAFERNGPLF